MTSTAWIPHIWKLTRLEVPLNDCFYVGDPPFMNVSNCATRKLEIPFHIMIPHGPSRSWQDWGGTRTGSCGEKCACPLLGGHWHGFITQKNPKDQTQTDYLLGFCSSPPQCNCGSRQGWGRTWCWGPLRPTGSLHAYNAHIVSASSYQSRTQIVMFISSMMSFIRFAIDLIANEFCLSMILPAKHAVWMVVP